MSEMPELIDATGSEYCTHTICNCTVVAPLNGDDAYCTEACKNADSGGIETETCDCGHPECDVP